MDETKEKPLAPVGAVASSADLDPAAAEPAPLPDILMEPAVVKHGVLSRSISAAMPPMIAIIAWFLPGFGHLLLRRWMRAVTFFVAVGGLAVAGYLMRGNVFAPHSKDPFGTLGFLADASSGVFYLLSHVFEKAGPDVARAMGDYGTRFIAGAGLLNMMGVCDAFEVARGRKF